MSEMVERVAKVLFGWMHGHDRWDEAEPEEREDCIEAACAVIEAMREPTEEGVLNGLVPVVRYPELLNGDARELVKAIWQGVIDEALE